jgi:hypothetical protein
LHDDIPAACPRNSAISAQTRSRSASDPSVVTRPASSSMGGCAFVHAAGTNDVLPPGSSNTNSIAPCRRIPPNTRNDRPCSG